VHYPNDADDAPQCRFAPVNTSLRACRISRFVTTTLDRVTRRDLALIAETRAALSGGSARLARLAASIRVTEIAAAIGVTPQAVSQWESGRRMPGAVHALSYGKALAALAPPVAG
jgi:DNA-binding XRE family transcriptional regulator